MNFQLMGSIYSNELKKFCYEICLISDFGASVLKTSEYIYDSFEVGKENLELEIKFFISKINQIDNLINNGHHVGPIQ